jgi:hypothetical protein
MQMERPGAILSVKRRIAKEVAAADRVDATTQSVAAVLVTAAIDHWSPGQSRLLVRLLGERPAQTHTTIMFPLEERRGHRGPTQIRRNYSATSAEALEALPRWGIAYRLGAGSSWVRRGGPRQEGWGFGRSLYPERQEMPRQEATRQEG